MRLNIDALQELYNTLLYGPVLSSPYAESPIDRAFKECDEKLSGSAAFAHIKDLENRCENLERSNKTLRDDNDKLGDKVIELKKKNEQLEKDIDICKRSNEMLLSANLEATRKKRKLEEEVEDLKKDLDAKSKENSTLVSANADLSDRNAKLQRNFDRINHLWTGQIQENMELRSKIADLQREKKNYETIEKEREDLVKERDEAKEDRDAWRRRATYAEKDRDLTKRNSDGWRSRAMQAEKRVRDLVNVNDNLTKKVVDLKKRINSVYASAMTGWPKDFRKEGMYDLWSKLREVADSTYSERLGCFLDVCSVEDLVEWDLEDFLEEYEKWVKKRTMPENPNFYFDNKPVIMGDTLEATVEVDKDLLATVCGVKPNEEEHKFEYGDAVRLPWRDYDYMYIGPEGKHIRLFDPKSRVVVCVSRTEKMTYQGGKIIIFDEDDLNKIWNTKK